MTAPAALSHERLRMERFATAYIRGKKNKCKEGRGYVHNILQARVNNCLVLLTRTCMSWKVSDICFTALWFVPLTFESIADKEKYCRNICGSKLSCERPVRDAYC